MNTATVDFLARAVALANSADTVERSAILYNAAEVVARIDPQRANSWSREAFNVAQQLQGWNQIAMQKNALRVLAINDPDTALTLYRHMASPLQSAQPGEPLAEDPRALSIPSIFSEIWREKGTSYLEELESLAVYLGETGQYPYRALGDIAADLGRFNLKAARSIQKDAIRYFERDSRFLSTNKEFVEFILNTHTVASHAILRTELSAAVEELNHPERGLGRIRTVISVTTSMGNAQFESENDYLLFRLLPLIKLERRQWAQNVMAAHPVLQHAPAIKIDTPVDMSGAISPTGTDSDERMRQALDRHRVFRSWQIAESNPPLARLVAEQITNSSLRDIALTTLAPAYQRVDAEQANAWLQAANQHLATMPSSLTKLQLIVAALKADIAMHRKELAHQLLPDAFLLARQISVDDQKQSQEKNSLTVRGSDELINLFAIDVAVESMPNVEGRLKSIHDPTLRAYAMISAARGLSGAA